jgi:hypothetical protein
MSDTHKRIMPQARRDGLLVQDLAEEVLVYDTERHKAHSLNPMAAAVWRHCDGQTGVTEITRRLQQDLSTPVDGAVVWSALAQLGKARLLTGEVRRASDTGEAGLSRRELMRILGVAAASIPLVTSIPVPAAAQGASCIGIGDPCDPGAPNCCPGLECTTAGTSLCVPPPP